MIDTSFEFCSDDGDDGGSGGGGGWGGLDNLDDDEKFGQRLSLTNQSSNLSTFLSIFSCLLPRLFLVISKFREIMLNFRNF